MSDRIGRQRHPRSWLRWSLRLVGAVWLSLPAQHVEGSVKLLGQQSRRPAWPEPIHWYPP
jgi:hypothetical protein